MQILKIVDKRFVQDENCLVIDVDLSSVSGVDLYFGAFADSVFPDYFGYNWNAFDECIQDLSWYPNKNIIFNAKQFDRILLMSEKDILYAVECIYDVCKQKWGHYLCFLLEIEDEHYDKIREMFMCADEH